MKEGFYYYRNYQKVGVQHQREKLEVSSKNTILFSPPFFGVVSTMRFLLGKSESQKAWNVHWLPKKHIIQCNELRRDDRFAILLECDPFHHP